MNAEKLREAFRRALCHEGCNAHESSVERLLQYARPLIAEAEREAAREMRERAFAAVMNRWRSAPNTRESKFEQNHIAAGCLASAEAINALPLPGDPAELEGKA